MLNKENILKARIINKYLSLRTCITIVNRAIKHANDNIYITETCDTFVNSV